MTELNTVLEMKDYIFYIEDNSIMVRYKNVDQEKNTVNLSKIAIESIGIAAHDSVAIITNVGLMKLQQGISSKLETIGFKFNGPQEALAVLNFIVLWMNKLDKKEKEL